MAKIKFGLVVVDGRGKLGGQVMAKNRAGNYIRTKTTPNNPRTAAQTLARNLFGSISQQWSGLTSTVRAGWNSAVSEWEKTDIFGDLKKPSGKALFQRLNNQAQSAGYTAVTTAPSKLNMVSGIVTIAQIDNANEDVYLTGNYSGSDARLMVFATPPLSDGTTFVKNKLRLVNTALANAYGSSTTYASYIAKFGVPTAGDNVYFGFKYVLPNGQASTMQVVKGIVV